MITSLAEAFGKTTRSAEQINSCQFSLQQLLPFKIGRGKEGCGPACLSKYSTTAWRITQEHDTWLRSAKRCTSACSDGSRVTDKRGLFAAMFS